MKQLLQTLDQLKKDFAGPKLNLVSREHGRDERFRSTYAAGTITLEAESSLASFYGINLLSAAVASGHLAEYLGERMPRFPLRPLWLQTMESWNGDRVDVFCQRVIELGYNALLLPLQDEEVFPSHICSRIHDWGLKIILKPDRVKRKRENFFDPECRERIQKSLLSLQQTIPWMEYLFWEGTYVELSKQPRAQHLLQADLALMEVRMLEEAMQKGCSLIYYLPCKDLSMGERQASWASTFFDDVGPNTIVSFPLVAGDPAFDHLPLHPFWAMLRRSPDISFTPLLPIVNIGAVGQGEGFWPTSTFSFMEQLLIRCHRHRFMGAVSLVKHLPKQGAFLHCNLWVASQLLWCPHSSASLFAETWFNAFHPGLDYPFVEKALKQVTDVACELSRLRFESEKTFTQEERRTTAESLLAQLSRLELVIQKRPSHSFSANGRPSFQQYLTYFIRDARRMIVHCLQRDHLPIATRFSDELGERSFWTDLKGGEGASGEVVVLDTPNPGEGVMRLIYDETVGL